MVWINNSNTAATLARVTDPIPVNTSYVQGSLRCEARGISVSQICTYDGARNRIVWEGAIAPDLGAVNETQAANEVVIVFRTSVNPGITSAENQGCANWDSNGDGSLATEMGAGQIPVCTDDPVTPASGDPTRWSQGVEPVVAVPTLNEWGMIFLIVLQGFGALYLLRRRAHG